MRLHLKLCCQSEEPMDEEEVDESMDWGPQDVENLHLLTSIMEDKKFISNDLTKRVTFLAVVLIDGLNRMYRFFSE